MPTIPTLDATGLTLPDVTEIRENHRERIEASSEFGVGTSTGPESVVGQIIDVNAEALSLVYDIIQAIYDQFSLANAIGIQLDNLGERRGVQREPAAKSSGEITATGTPATVITVGAEVRVPGAGRFVTTEEKTIGGGGTVDIPVESIELGPVEGAAGSITEIVTAIPGWTSVTNAADVVLGQLVESDSRYRTRIRRSGAIAGTGTDAAIRARVEALTTVTHAAAVSNRSVDTDPITGQLGCSVAVYVWPVLVTAEDKREVAETIWGPAGLTAGILAYGSEAYTVIDSQGNAQPVAFSFATEVEIYFVVVILQSGVGFPTNAETLIKDAIGDYFDLKQGIGTDVLPLPILLAINEVVPGIEGMQLRLKAGDPPGATNTAPVAIEDLQIATVDPANITVTIL